MSAQHAPTTVMTKARERYLAQQKVREWFEVSRTLAQRHESLSAEVESSLKKWSDLGSEVTILSEARESAAARLSDQRNLLIGVRRYKERMLTLADMKRVMDPVEHALDQQEALFGSAEMEAKRILASVDEAESAARRTVSMPPVAYHPGGSSPVAVQQKASALPSEVRDYDDFVIAHGGHSLGWPEEEHQLFLRTVLEGNRHTSGGGGGTTTGNEGGGGHPTFSAAEGANRAVLIDVLHHRLPTIPIESIDEHITLYDCLCALHDKKRVALNAWKSQKLADAENDAEVRRLREQRALIVEKQNKTLRESKAVAEREAEKDKLAAWRAEKQRAVIREKQLMQDAETKRKRDQQALVAMRQVERAALAHRREDLLKNQLQALQNQKLEEGSQARQASTDAEHEQQIPPALQKKQQLQRRHCNDLLKTAQKSAKIQQQKEKTQQRGKSQQRYWDAHAPLVAHTVTADRSRLTKPTVASENRRAGSASAADDTTTARQCQTALLRGTDYLSPKPLSGFKVNTWAGRSYNH